MNIVIVLELTAYLYHCVTGASNIKKVEWVTITRRGRKKTQGPFKCGYYGIGVKKKND